MSTSSPALLFLCSFHATCCVCLVIDVSSSHKTLEISFYLLCGAASHCSREPWLSVDTQESASTPSALTILFDDHHIIDLCASKEADIGGYLPPKGQVKNDSIAFLTVCHSGADYHIMLPLHNARNFDVTAQRLRNFAFLDLHAVLLYPFVNSQRKSRVLLTASVIECNLNRKLSMSFDRSEIAASQRSSCKRKNFAPIRFLLFILFLPDSNLANDRDGVGEFHVCEKQALQSTSLLT